VVAGGRLAVTQRAAGVLTAPAGDGIGSRAVAPAPAARDFQLGAPLWAARVVWAVHLGVVLLILTGWALPWRPVVWAVVAVTAAAQSSWLLCGHRCALTVLEEMLRSARPRANRRVPSAPDEPTNFTVDLLSRLVDGPAPQRWTNLAIYAVTWLAFATALARLMFS